MTTVRAASLAYGAGPNPRAAVDRVLDELHAAASGADDGRYFPLYAEEAVFIGTDGTERWSLSEFREYARAYCDEARAGPACRRTAR